MILAHVPDLLVMVGRMHGLRAQDCGDRVVLTDRLGRQATVPRLSQQQIRSDQAADRQPDVILRSVRSVAGLLGLAIPDDTRPLATIVQILDWTPGTCNGTRPHLPDDFTQLARQLLRTCDVVTQRLEYLRYLWQILPPADVIALDLEAVAGLRRRILSLSSRHR